ncbi:MAG TPA: hypothetical protein VKH43_05875 [Thermoanaerobaculia bacterium]|nr:hypothetical protein [Thermoanaerobaculia bacterium]
MNPRIPETALSFLLAAAFALAGDLLLAKRSSKLREWIESLLVGAGVSAAALFPLSLAFPGYALGALALLLAAAAVTWIFVRYRARGLPKAGAPRPRVRPDPSSIVFFTITLLAGLAFAVLNWRYVYLWDGFQIWAAKAQLLFYQGDLKANLASGDYLNLKLAYPALVPMFEALLSKLRGGFDFNSLKPLFAVFYLSMVVATYEAARPAAGRTGALAATALLCLLPPVSTAASAGGYADMPMAAYAAAVAASFFAGDSLQGNRSLPWLIGGLTTVKSEGTILAAICCIVAGAAALGRREPLKARAAAAFLAPPAVFVLLRIGYVRWVNSGDPTYASVNAWSIRRGVTRIPEVLRLAAEQLFDWKTWGLLWAAFFAAVILLFLSRPGWRLRTAAVATLLGLASYTTVFLFTNWPVRLQIEQAYPRLLLQLAPAAAVILVSTFAAMTTTRGRPQE